MRRKSACRGSTMCIFISIEMCKAVLGTQRGHRVGPDHPESGAAHLGDVQLQGHLDSGNRPWRASTAMVSELMLDVRAHAHPLMRFNGMALVQHIPFRRSGAAQMASGGHSGWDRRGALQSAGPASWSAT